MTKAAAKAQALLDQCGIIHPPINPEKIARHLGIEIKRLAFSDELSGVLMRNDSGSVIALNKEHHRLRQRFTIAHELGHFALKHKGDMFVDQTVLNRRDGRSSFAIDPQEIEANAFAASLLMPQQLLLNALEAIVDGDLTPEREGLIAKLAKKFEVSEEAMRYRLVNLGIISAQV